MGQFSMEISRATGSVLSGNQQSERGGMATAVREVKIYRVI